MTETVGDALARQADAWIHEPYVGACELHLKHCLDYLPRIDSGEWTIHAQQWMDGFWLQCCLEEQIHLRRCYIEPENTTYVLRQEDFIPPSTRAEQANAPDHPSA